MKENKNRCLVASRVQISVSGFELVISDDSMNAFLLCPVRVLLALAPERSSNFMSYVSFYDFLVCSLVPAQKLIAPLSCSFNTSVLGVHSLSLVSHFICRRNERNECNVYVKLTRRHPLVCRRLFFGVGLFPLEVVISSLAVAARPERLLEVAVACDKREGELISLYCDCFPLTHPANK